jgi:hypothetical protein
MCFLVRAEETTSGHKLGGLPLGKSASQGHDEQRRNEQRPECQAGEMRQRRRQQRKQRRAAVIAHQAGADDALLEGVKGSEIVDFRRPLLPGQERTRPEIDEVVAECGW